MRKLENKQVFFKDVTDTDSRKKINRAEKIIPQETLDSIEEGVTIEKIDKLTKDVPVFMYLTQITIHGLFPRLTIDRLWGYKNIFQNKNKSIGIRYSAIDEEKRQQIEESIKHAGFSYQRNSSEQKFVKLYRTTKENLKADIDKIVPFYNRIDTSNIYGGKQLYAGEMMGMYYILLTIDIGAIYQKDVQSFIDSVITPKELKAAQEKRKKEKEEYEAEMKRIRDEEEAKRQQQLKKFEKDIQWIEGLKKYSGYAKEGKYISYRFNYNDELKFCADYIYKEKGKKLPRILDKDFETLKDAIDWLKDAKPSQLDGRKARRISGYVFEEKKDNPTKQQDTKDVYIIDYSEKAIAIFGNTKPIKDELKKIGCRFNPRLTNNGNKEAGWIAKREAKQQVMEVIS